MDYIEIKGYKSINSTKVEFAPINILIGANGAGKSNFLSFFEFLNRLYNQNLTEYVALAGGEEKMLHKGSKNTASIYSKIKFGKNGYSFEIEKGESSFIFVSEGLWYDNNPYYNNPTDIASYSNEARIKVYSMARAEYIRKYLNSFQKYHFHDTGRNSPFNKLSHIDNDIYFLYEKGDNLAAFLFNIQQKDRLVYNRIVNTVQSIAPYFSDFYLQPNNEGFIRLQWQDKFTSNVYGVTDLSDGTIRFIALATLFLQPNLPTTIIIDEPELGLHPFAISKLAGMIQSAASRDTQVIAATQSADLVNHFEAKDIITVDQKKGESSFNRLDDADLSQWLDEYNIGDLWQKNIIQGGQPS
ncbi:Predicted ATPase [Mucilaginibacter lappiensis]|uniref:ATPase n=1 Tax=Mucilaginibacter lappiensis TaxID=354630 RepID=A0ABR6PKG1_9SPHI|nr:AAA family ATPase [Mucilaginibacter lappiensis]MBB6110215.1 putative ATPase [Mucilaginibacter lappiensis]SIR26495.1 Predicted ATPase [Mucilaginibacter lappiensis]